MCADMAVPDARLCTNEPAPLILASASPRRRELLDQIGVSYRVVVHDTDETRTPSESPEIYVSRLARQKAASVNARPDIFGLVPVLGADTIVVCDQTVLGKPADEADAVRMLGLLSGRRHEVMTAVCVMQGQQEKSLTVRTGVWFRELSDRDMAAYWRSGEPAGKAGAYAIQGLGALFVARIEGSYSAVVGLPIFETGQLLASIGIQNGLGESCV